MLAPDVYTVRETGFAHGVRKQRFAVHLSGITKLYFLQSEDWSTDIKAALRDIRIRAVDAALRSELANRYFCTVRFTGSEWSIVINHPPRVIDIVLQNDFITVSPVIGAAPRSISLSNPNWCATLAVALHSDD